MLDLVERLMVAEFPLAGGELVRLLNEVLGTPVGGVRMRVERVSVGRAEVAVRVIVADESASLGVWDVDVPVEAGVDASVLGRRLREWWVLKGVEPGMGRWGRPV
ncbi:hypothetical protein [Actinomadura harenae]|uniref:Uncharacterized protein n=1 Tax=Actinomadura harenae TaxID=2483351 RepID=A0A3M2LJ73_9ACTN|nr:hypothetical protein [Actinomadura harenae]RMI37176.1 hypothetical protein EBO15_36545 [Actinomadura harenae]